MTTSEFSNEFDVLYNNITSNQAPGLNEYEKSVFLTKAQDEIIKAYFSPELNKSHRDFEGSAKRQVDFSTIMSSYSSKGTPKAVYTDISKAYLRLTNSTGESIIFTLTKLTTITSTTFVISSGKTSLDCVYGSSLSSSTTYSTLASAINDYCTEKNISLSAAATSTDTFASTITGIQVRVAGGYSFSNALLVPQNNAVRVSFPSDMLMSINEQAVVTRGSDSINLQIVPLAYQEFIRLMSKPYKRPLKWQAWRILVHDSSNIAEVVVGPADTVTEYIIRYIKRPQPIILDILDGVTIDGYVGADSNGNPVTSSATQGLGCELDPILHHEILQRAVELAKAAWTGDLQSQVALGQTSETNMGISTQQR